jgi:hypothetical protein
LSDAYHRLGGIASGRRNGMIRGFLAGVSLVVLTVSGISAARAADPAFCRGYTQAALNQVRAGLSNPRCQGGMQGPRWSSDFNVHYQWCLGASFTATGEERDARTNYLRGCRG